jgi:hypothetical protein
MPGSAPAASANDSVIAISRISHHGLIASLAFSFAPAHLRFAHHASASPLRLRNMVENLLRIVFRHSGCRAS